MDNAIKAHAARLLVALSLTAGGLALATSQAEAAEPDYHRSVTVAVKAVKANKPGTKWCQVLRALPPIEYDTRGGAWVNLPSGKAQLAEVRATVPKGQRRAVCKILVREFVAITRG